ncbi:response regulator [Sphingobacterium sp. HJSM2_6]|uniref:ATP-binding response regulator n=1 Tax=Sphingobacterium sp. HJSM2_6 TaxID=3366264 RepID=UPI003BB9DB83
MAEFKTAEMIQLDMNKFNFLKWQFIISIIIAYLIIIFSYVYFLGKQKEFAEDIQTYMDAAQEKFHEIQQWEIAVQKLAKYKTIEKGADPVVLNNMNEEILKSLNILENPNAIMDQAPKSIDALKRFSASIGASQTIQNTEINLDGLSIANDLGQIMNTAHSFTNDIINLRKEKTTLKQKALNTTRLYTALLGIFSLIVILYVVIQTLRILNYLRKSSQKERELNNTLTHTTNELENVNWVLQNSSKIHNQINGIQNEAEISKTAIKSIFEIIEYYAAAIFVRKIDSYEFQLKASHGMENRGVYNKFLLGEGLLGTITETQKHQIIPISDIKSIKLSTASLDYVAAEVILFPVMHENYCIAIIEIIGNFQKDKIDSIIEFLGRVSRSLGSALNARQSHALVEELLEETQRQTEELEAQQEELRITNEELVYKTNLLEASEEELRVQQEELSQANLELNAKAVELERRNFDLNEAHFIVEQKINEVEQASKYKSEFMANMSHELRTPLNSVLILAKLLQDNKASNLTDEQVKYANVIYNAGSDLLQLINEILDLAKIESGKVEVHQDVIYSKDFTQNLESLFKIIAKEKSINFAIDINECPAKFVTDEYRLEQVIKNFLSNAFKFTENSGNVTLNVFEKSGSIHFEVIDSGIGIPEDKQSLIFEAFRQEDGSTSRKYGGTGLGLSISREIASLLNGRITLESKLDQGSKFTLIIPYISVIEESQIVESVVELLPAKKAVSSSPSPASESKKTQESKDKVILIIEDDINFADILKEFAEEYGFKVLNAYDGLEGIELAKAKTPDAIILDVMLPLADGWEVLRTLKAEEITKNIPIHMMSAASFDKKDFLEKGAIGFMSKPVTEESISLAFDNISLSIDKDIKKILLIEDQEFQSDLIKKAFAEQKTNVIQAFTIESGLKKLEQEENLDCIILDIKLPDGSGLEMLDKIKSNPKFEKLPVIINTAYDLTIEQTERILRHTQAMVLKSSKSNSRLIDEVNLFLNKVSTPAYKPIRNPEKIDAQEHYGTNILDNKVVLIADDDMRNVFALSSSLEQYNMKIEIANNGREAVELVNNPDKHFDIVLMDIMMPEMDGYEAIQEIRKNKKHNNLPILAVTAKAMKGDREKSIELGANDYVSKPIDLDKLVSLMQVWLS